MDSCESVAAMVANNSPLVPAAVRVASSSAESAVNVTDASM